MYQDWMKDYNEIVFSVERVNNSDDENESKE